MKFLDATIYLILLSAGFGFGWYSKTIGAQKLPATTHEKETLASPQDHHHGDSDNNSDHHHPEAKPENSAKSQHAPTRDTAGTKPFSKKAPNTPKPAASAKLKIEPQKNSSLFIQEATRLLAQAKVFDAISAYNYNATPLSDKERKWFLSQIIEVVQKQIKDKRYSKAINNIEESRRVFQNAIALIHLKITAYLNKGEANNALEFISREVYYIQDEQQQKKLLELSRKIRDNQIKQLLKKGLTQKAKEAYEYAISEDPDNNRYYYELAILCFNERQFEKAEDNLRFLLGDETYGKDAQNLINRINQIYRKQDARANAPQEQTNKKEVQAIEIPLIKKGSSFFINISINDSTEDILLLIDTGASLTTLSKKVTDKLGFSGVDYRKVRWFKTAGGEVKMAILKLKVFQVHHMALKNFTVAVDLNDALHFDGLLGMNFLRFFNFTIDTKRNLLILKSK